MIYLSLDERVVSYERTSYTIFTLLGDLGGFNSAIIIFPAYFMSIYSERMFHQALAQEIPIRNRRKHRKLSQDQLNNENVPPTLSKRKKNAT